MARVLLLTNSMGASAEVIPALALLSHQVRVLPAEASALIDAPDYEVIFVDARRDLPGAKSLMRVINSTGISAPLILITTEGGLSAINAEWGASDVILDTAGPAEIEPAEIKMHASPGIFGRRGTAPLGVYRSDDGGETWRRMPRPDIAERMVGAFPSRVMRMNIAHECQPEAHNPLVRESFAASSSTWWGWGS